MGQAPAALSCLHAQCKELKTQLKAAEKDAFAARSGGGGGGGGGVTSTRGIEHADAADTAPQVRRRPTTGYSGSAIKPGDKVRASPARPPCKIDLPCRGLKPVSRAMRVPPGYAPGYTQQVRNRSKWGGGRRFV